MSKLKKAIKLILTGLALNYVTPVIAFSISQNFFTKDNINIRSAKNTKFKLKKNMHIEDYLCMASAYAHKAAKTNQSFRNSNCEDYTRSTLKVFNYLTKKNSNPELQERVKIVSGLVKIDKTFGHEWIEFKDDDNVNKIFDPTFDTPPYFDSNKLQNYCNKQSLHFNPVWNIEYRFTIGNGKIALPSSEILTYPYGLAGLLSILISNSKDYIKIYFSKNY